MHAVGAGVVVIRPEVDGPVREHRGPKHVTDLGGLPGDDVDVARNAALPGDGAVRDERAARTRCDAPHVEGAVVLHRAGDVPPDLHRRIRAGGGLVGVGRQGRIAPAAHAAVRDPDGAPDVTPHTELGEAGRGGERTAERAGRVAPDPHLPVLVEDAETSGRARGERAVGLATRRMGDDRAVAEAVESPGTGEDRAAPLIVAARRPLADHGVGEVAGRVRGADRVGLGLPGAVRARAPRAIVVQPRDRPVTRGREDLQRADVRQIRDAFRLELLDRHAAGVALLPARVGRDERQAQEHGEGDKVLVIVQVNFLKCASRYDACPLWTARMYMIVRFLSIISQINAKPGRVVRPG